MALDNNKDTWIFIESKGDAESHSFKGLALKFHELLEGSFDNVCIVMLSNTYMLVKDNIRDLGFNKVYVIDCSSANTYDERYISDCIVQLVKKYRPRVFCFESSSFTKSIAPRVAAMLEVGLTADCTDFELCSEIPMTLLQTRPIHDNTSLATITNNSSRPQMLTVKKNMFYQENLNEAVKPEIIRFKPTVKVDKSLIKLIKKQTKSTSSSLNNSDIILVIGAGIGSKDNALVVEELADKLNARIAVTRKVADLGWFQCPNIIGQTGQVVSPKLYVGFGVSGAIQHLCGMKNSSIIIGINNDPKANIFSIADYGYIGDAYQVAKELLVNSG